LRERVKSKGKKMETRPIKEGDTVKVIAQGKFHSQEVNVLAVKVRTFKRTRKTTYRLATMRDEKYFPTWWDSDEIALVKLAR
jgi:hypothetical protein